MFIPTVLTALGPVLSTSTKPGVLLAVAGAVAVRVGVVVVTAPHAGSPSVICGEYDRPLTTSARTPSRSVGLSTTTPIADLGDLLGHGVDVPLVVPDTERMDSRGPLDTLREELSGQGHLREDADGGSDVTFRRLLNAIVTLDFPPGALVAERDLMAAANATRASMRPAVIRLAELGLIRSLPRKGLVVAPLDTLDAHALYEARWPIEARAARLAALRARDDEIEALEALAEEPREDATDGRATWRIFLEHDQALHLRIAAAAKNPYLYDALTRILPLASRLWHWAYGELGVGQHVRFGHHDIVDAVRARDADAAESATISHVEQAQSVLRDVFVNRLGGAG